MTHTLRTLLVPLGVLLTLGGCVELGQGTAAPPSDGAAQDTGGDEPLGEPQPDCAQDEALQLEDLDQALHELEAEVEAQVWELEAVLDQGLQALQSAHEAEVDAAWEATMSGCDSEASCREGLDAYRALERDLDAGYEAQVDALFQDFQAQEDELWEQAAREAEALEQQLSQASDACWDDQGDDQDTGDDTGEPWPCDVDPDACDEAW